MWFKTMSIIVTVIVILTSSYMIQAQLQNTYDSKLNYFDNDAFHTKREVLNANNSLQVFSTEKNISSQMLFGDIMANTMKNFLPFSYSNKNCTRDGQEFMINLRNHTLWAIRMYESSAKYPGSIAFGEVTELGNFDQCMSVSSKIPEINGAYAIAKIRFRRFNEIPSVELPDYLPTDQEKSKRDLLAVGPENISWALCFPESCTNEDIRSSVEYVLIPAYRTYNIAVEVIIPQLMYTSKNTTQYYTKGSVINAISNGFIILMVAGTIYNLIADRSKSETSNLFSKCLCSYSIITNMKNLMRGPRRDELVISNFFKIIGMIGVVLVHRLFLDLGNPVLYSKYTENMHSDVWSLFIKSPVMVETFFVLGGFFTYISVETKLRREKSLNLMYHLSNRLIRIIPMYVTVILIFSFVLPHMGDGPLWKNVVYPEAEYCRKNWWTNLLFINNYVNTEEMCMLHSWYLACDMHFFIVGTFLTYFTWKLPKAGIVIFSIVFAFSIYLPAKSIYDNEQWGVLLLNYRSMKNVRTVEHFKNIYIKSHYRITTYLIGLATAYIYLRMRKTSLKFSVKSRTIGFITSILLYIFCYIITGYFYIPNINYNPWIHLLYFTLQRVVYSLTIAYILVIGSLSNFGIINSICESKFVTFLSKISYTVYLTHFIILFRNIGQIRQPQYGNNWIFYWKANADLTTTLLYALPLYLIIEEPSVQIFNHVIRTGSDWVMYSPAIGIQKASALIILLKNKIFSKNKLI